MRNNKTEFVLGIIGGSGVYEIDGLTNTRWEKLSSPFGEPSDALLFGRWYFSPGTVEGTRFPHPISTFAPISMCSKGPV